MPALAFRRREENRAALVFEGRDALDSGGWHEGMNLAGAVRAPLIVVVDAEGSDFASPASDTRAVAGGYGFAFDTIGQDPFEDLMRTVAAARPARGRGHGPDAPATRPAIRFAAVGAP